MTTEKTEIDYDSMSLEDLERELDKIDQPTPEIQEKMFNYLSICLSIKVR